MNPITTIAELDAALSEPTVGVCDTLTHIDGDVVVLGAGGKMGPTLARMVRRAFDTLGQPHRRVYAVSRFSSPLAQQDLQQHGVQTITCDLLDRTAIQALPEAPNVIYMAGQKFGTAEAPEQTWAMNTLGPAYVAERYAGSRIVVFSTGCVYPFVSTAGPGANEETPLTPIGEYANSCVGRERIFMHFAHQHRTPTLLFRLCYAIDLRYGVLCDIAQRVWHHQPVDVSMGYAHVIWQGDANARAIQSLRYAACPPVALNVTGLERVSIRTLAHRFGRLFDREPHIVGTEGDTAWLWDASRSYAVFGPPRVTLDEMIHATADWHRHHGPTLGKPTHFEVRDGGF